MTTKHTLTAHCPFGIGETEVKVTYTYTAGRPAQGPSYASGGEPAEPPEVELVEAVLPGCTLNAEHRKLLIEWAEEWLAGEGWDEAVDNAEEA